MNSVNGEVETADSRALSPPERLPAPGRARKSRGYRVVSTKAKERRAVLDQMLTARASVAPPERPALAPRHLGPIAEQANLYAEHVAIRAKLYDDAKAQGRLLLQLDPKAIRATEFQQSRTNGRCWPVTRNLSSSRRACWRTDKRRRFACGRVKDALPFEFEIVSGHRRHAACLALDAKTEGGFPIIAIVDARGRRNARSGTQDVPGK